MATTKTTDQKKKQTTVGCAVLLVLAVVFYFICGTDDTTSKPVTRKERIEKQFSSWDGDHLKLKEHIKENLKDPDSYKNIKTVYWDRDSFITVQTEYTATNTFGGRVRGVAMAKCDLDGNIIEIISQE